MLLPQPLIIMWENHVNNNNGVNDPTINTPTIWDLRFFSTERMKAIIRETLYGKIYKAVIKKNIIINQSDVI